MSVCFGSSIWLPPWTQHNRWIGAGAGPGGECKRWSDARGHRALAVFRCNGVRRFERGALRRFERRAFGASKIEG
jgi:hypothetical protein